MISLSAITSLLSLSAALVATWVMEVTTHQAGLKSSIARLALAQRIALAAFAIFLMLNAVTAVHHAGPALARQSSPGRRDHGVPACVQACRIRAERTRPAKPKNPKNRKRPANLRQGR